MFVTREVGVGAPLDDVGVAGIEFDRTVVVGDRLIVLAQAGKGDTAVEVGAVIIRHELDRRIEADDGVVVLALGVVCEAKVVEREDGVLATEFARLDRLGIELDRCVKIAAALRRETGTGIVEPGSDGGHRKHGQQGRE